MRHIDTTTTFCGIPVRLSPPSAFSFSCAPARASLTPLLAPQTPLPIFVAPAGLARLGHPDGEQNIVRGVAPHNILQVVSSGASCSIDEIFAVKEPEQSLAWQFYVPSDKALAEEKLKKALALGAKAIFVTVDVPVLGKRERDLKLKARSQNYEHPIAAVRPLPQALLRPLKESFE